MSFKFTLVLIPILVFQISAEAKIYGPKRYDSVGLLTYVSTELYNTTANFDLNGKEKKLESSNSYMLLDVPVGLRYLASPTWGVEAELKASYAKSKSSTLMTGGERTNSVLHEARFSTDTMIDYGNFDLIPEFEVIIPLSKISSRTDSVMVGEGAQSLIGKLHVQAELGGSDFFSYVGYQIRDSGRSDLMPWSLGLGLNRDGGSFIGARVFGFQTINDDSDKKNPYTREALNNKVNGGSLKFYSVNPSVTSAEALWFFKIQKQLQFQVNAGLDLIGERYSKGFFAGLNIMYDWGEKQKSMRNRPKKEMVQPRGSGIAVETETIDFKEDTNENNDQKYFAPPPPPRVVPRPAPRVQSRAKSRTKVGPTDQQIQNQMDDVEMKIELKRKKK